MLNLSFLKNSAINYKGWKTNRKIIVFESDDWGSIRMPSKQAYDRLLKSGIPVDNNAYCRYDCIESSDDLCSLFEVLLKHRDCNNNNPIITANTVVSNPNFRKIRQSNFTEYFYEPFTETLKSYSNSQNSFSLIEQGINQKVWLPQFHGREHVNVLLWLDLLRKQDKNFTLAFNEEMWGISSGIFGSMRNIQAALDFEDSQDLYFHKESIKSGLEMFYEIFGYRSKSFIANNFIWSNELLPYLKNSGVITIQGMKYQKLPLGINTKRKMIRHYVGEINKLGQIYLIRNCRFEPSLDYNSKHSVKNCLENIENAFFWKKPAIITSHRLNFIGTIEEKNRSENLSLFNELLIQILIKWPEVEFMASDQLGDLIDKEKEII